VNAVLGEAVHAKRVDSLADSVLGTMHAAKMAVSTIGRALAEAKGLESKHAIKQVDRLLSNAGIDVAASFEPWVRFIVGSRDAIVVAVDWTEYDHDDHATLTIHMVTSHGRATPLMWKTVRKSRLRGKRNKHEDQLVARLRLLVPADTTVTVLADRGFGDAALYTLLGRIQLDHIIRFRGDVTVTDENGESRPAKEWLRPDGRARILRNVKVTKRNVPVPAIVCVWARDMDEPWFLACGEGSRTRTAAQLVKLYSRRFTIEESYRDTKDVRFGKGLSMARISSTDRRDRLLLLSALATALLTILGAAGESLGFDRLLRANTVRRRTHSLFFQGSHYFAALPNMKPDKRERLLAAFGELLVAQPLFRQLFGTL